MKKKAEQLQRHEDLYLTLDQLCQTAEVMGAVIERLKNYMTPLENLEHPTQVSSQMNTKNSDHDATHTTSTKTRTRKVIRANSLLNMVH